MLLVVDLTPGEATGRLYRREIHHVGSGNKYKAPPPGKSNAVRIQALSNFEGIATVLYTEIAANILPLSTIELARLAIKSARARGDGRDGISYLRDALANGIHTPLSDGYRQKILDLVGARDLDEALALARASGP